MANRKYNRVFVLMTGKNAGQSLNGSCDMEVINGKGRLYAYVGKLNKRTYTPPRKLYLISVGLMGSVAVPAGKLVPKGKNSSIEAEFDPDNLFGSGITFEEINAIAVWGENDGPNNAVLEGFVSKRINWHSNLEVFGEGKLLKPLHTEKAKVISVEPEINQRNSVIEKTEVLYKKAVYEPEPVEDVIGELSVAEEFDQGSAAIKEDEIQETADKVEETKIPELTVTEGVKEKVKEDVSGLAEKLSENINEADKLTNIAAAESIADLSPHNTFKAIAQKFRRELDMLDEMGIIDKTMFFDDTETKKEETVQKTESIAKNKSVQKTETVAKSQPVQKTETVSKAEPVKRAEPVAQEDTRKVVHLNNPTAKEANAKVSQVKTSKLNNVEETVKPREVNRDINASLSRNEEIPKKIEAEKKAETANKAKTAFAEMTPTDRLFLTNDRLSTNDGKEWIKIDYREAYFVEEAIRDLRCFFVRNAARKGRHMIIGRDGHDVFIGVPGEKGERRYAEKNGFYDFLTVSSSLTAGYWIKAI